MRGRKVPTWLRDTKQRRRGCRYQARLMETYDRAFYSQLEYVAVAQQRGSGDSLPIEERPIEAVEIIEDVSFRDTPDFGVPA